MLAVALAVLWAGYTITLWGYCLIQGYDVTFSDMFFSGTWPPSHGTGAANAQDTASTPAAGSTGKTGTFGIAGPLGGYSHGTVTVPSALTPLPGIPVVIIPNANPIRTKICVGIPFTSKKFCI